jgi:hypothetical protein
VFYNFYGENMANNSTILNNLMNRDTYVTGKGALIVGEIILKDMQKILHHTIDERLNAFVLQTIETIHRKISIHLAMNNMSGIYELVNLEGKDFELHPQKNYFFYKFDGIHNFSRGLESICFLTGIIEEGNLSCLNIFRPEGEKMMWYQKEEPVIYINNQITWSDKHQPQRYTTKKKPIFIINTENHEIYKTLQEIQEVQGATIMGFNNFFLELYYLLDNSIDYILIGKNMHPLQEIILNQLVNMGAISIVEFQNHLIIKKY